MGLLEQIIILIISGTINIICIAFAVKAYKRQIEIHDYQKTLLRNLLETHNDVKKLKKELDEIKSRIES